MDNSQTITTDELLLVMKNLGMMATKDEVKDMLSEVDEDGKLPGNAKGWGLDNCITHVEWTPNFFSFPLSSRFSSLPAGKWSILGQDCCF